MMNNTKLKPCPSRFGRRYDGRAVLTCGYRMVTVEECIECQEKRRETSRICGPSTGA